MVQDGCGSCSCLIHVPGRKQKEGDKGQQEPHTSLWTVPLLRNLSQSPILQLSLTSNWLALSHVVTLAAREAGKWSLFPGYTAAPKNIRVLLPTQKEWIPGGQLAGSATPDLRTPTSHAGQNALSHLNPMGRSHSHGSRELGKTGVVFSWVLLCALQKEASGRGAGSEGRGSSGFWVKPDPVSLGCSGSDVPRTKSPISLGISGLLD